MTLALSEESLLIIRDISFILASSLLHASINFKRIWGREGSCFEVSILLKIGEEFFFHKSILGKILLVNNILYLYITFFMQLR